MSADDAIALLAGWLVTLAVHGTLLAAGAWLLARLLPGRLRLHDALWKAAIAAPPVTAALPFLAAGGLGLPAAGQVVERVWALRVGAGGLGLEMRVPGALAVPDPVAARLVVGLWLAGAAALVLRLARRPRVPGPRRTVESPELVARAGRARERAGIRRPIRITCAPALATPVALGRREVCLPADFRDLPPDQQDALLAHELAHLRRRDPAWSLAADLLGAIAWPLPLQRLAARRLRETAELICDRDAARMTGTARPLAEALATLARRIRAEGDGVRHAATAAAGRGESALLCRVRRLLEPPTAPDERAATPVLAALALAVAVAVTAPGAALSLGVHTVDRMMWRGEDGTRVDGEAITTDPGGPVRIPAGRALRLRLKTPDGRRLELEARGVAVRPATGGVVAVDAGGHLRVAEDGARRRTLAATASSGEMRVVYAVDGVPAPFDAAARVWLADALSAVLRPR